MFMLVLTGCWDRREINELSLVTGLALEQSDDEEAFSLTIEVLNASEMDPDLAEGLTPTITYQLKGLTMGELLTKMNLGITRELDFSHARTLIVDEEIAREGIAKFIQFLEKSGYFRTDFQIIVAKGVKASQIITTTYPIPKVPSLKIFEQLMTIRDTWGGFPQSDLNQFVYDLTQTGREPVVGALTIRGDATKGKNIDDNRELDLPAIIEYDGIAVFEKDRMIGYLSPEEARSYMWTQDVTETAVTVPCGEGYFSIQVYNAYTTIDTKFNNGLPEVTVDLIVEGDIYDNQCPNPLDDYNTYFNYEDILAKHIEEKIVATVTTVQEKFGVDIFGFGEHFNKQHHKEYKKYENQWNEKFKQLNVTANVEANLRRDGMRTKSFLTSKRKE